LSFIITWFGKKKENKLSGEHIVLANMFAKEMDMFFCHAGLLLIPRRVPAWMVFDGESTSF